MGCLVLKVVKVKLTCDQPWILIPWCHFHAADKVFRVRVMWLHWFKGLALNTVSQLTQN